MTPLVRTPATLGLRHSGIQKHFRPSQRHPINYRIGFASKCQKADSVVRARHVEPLDANGKARRIAAMSNRIRRPDPSARTQRGHALAKRFRLFALRDVRFRGPGQSGSLDPILLDGRAGRDCGETFTLAYGVATESRAASVKTPIAVRAKLLDGCAHTSACTASHPARPPTYWMLELREAFAGSLRVSAAGPAVRTPSEASPQTDQACALRTD